ncbi:hypothetical protein Ahy_A09g046371 isoform A [Arachis hypogaea]|uniref:Uncharacterized protein n=1 Tax=Arachis hypogaea TaxID=3818 RepID=A0A445BPL4_ARAHY|nr:hypothetical protein Ahy_A09g046371 isoform A [Arachis hypogaea]
MASKLEGGAYLSSFVDAISKKLSSILEDDSVLEGNDSALELLERLDEILCDVEPVLDDAELKQFGNDRVKKWLVDLQDALYVADDFLDELSTKAATATPREPGNSYDWSRPVDSIIEDSGVNVIEKIVAKLGSVVRRKDSKIRHLSLFSNYRDTITLFGEACERAVHLRTALDFSSYRPSIDVESNPLLLQQFRVFSFRVKSVPDSIGELIHLRYLNLSGTCIVTLPESICKLYNLQTLKLRGCVELEMLPSRMQDLVNLCHLDIRGASRLKEIPKGMNKLKHLHFLSDYIVGKQENGMRELGTLDNLHGSFCISKLENVKNSGEALEAKMGNKKHINTLELNWLPDGDIDDVQTERDILDKLQPHQNLTELSIHGYPGERFPDWLGLSCYSNMTKLSLDSCMNCCELPSLGQLPSLQHLEISKLDGLEKIDLEFYNKNNASFQQETPFKCLETLEIEYMYSWREWHFPDEFDGFPQLRILEIRNCPVLSGDLPSHLPALEELTIDGCKELACSLPRAPKLHKLHVKCDMFYGNLELHKELDIRNCPEIDCFAGECLPPSLEKLVIVECQKLASWISSNVLHSEGLTHLWLGSYFDVKSFPREGCLPASLKSLQFWDFPDLETLDCKGLHHLTSLTYIAIRYSEKLENITEEHLLASIKKIYIGEECPLRSKLEEMEDLRIQLGCDESESCDEYAWNDEDAASDSNSD